ncbi:hypothetical protein J6590_020061 [Homalodisca vitripennis]|nr:hypothetical protein J6590_020061 [Homalodisca vitripennis]
MFLGLVANVLRKCIATRQDRALHLNAVRGPFSRMLCCRPHLSDLLTQRHVLAGRAPSALTNLIFVIAAITLLHPPEPHL